jgi:AAA ATPase domain
VGPSTGLFDVGAAQRPATPPIRGRAGELKVIGALVTALVGGRGGVLVIEGPPGIGKSRLLTEVMALADKCGVRTLFGEAFEYQQTVPFSRCSWPRCAPIRRSETPTRCAGWAARTICATGWCADEAY